MSVKKHTAMFNDLFREYLRSGLIAQHHPGRNAKRHDPLFHLKPRHKKFALVQATPLPIEIGPAIHAMITEADKIQAGLL